MLAITPKKAAFAAYSRMLTEDWRRDLPEKVLQLLWNMLNRPPTNGLTDPMIRLLDPKEESPLPNDYFATILDRIASASRFLHFDMLPEISVPYVVSSRSSKSVLVAIRLSAWLTLAAHTKLSGNTAFLVDVQALAFQAAIHFALPAVKQKHPAEHAILLRAAALFCVEFAAHDPAHYTYMMSMMHGYLGDDQERLHSLYASFRFTSPDDHSFLTKAQEYWMDLLDLQRYSEAEKFLNSLRWWALPQQQNEIGEMVHDAYQFIFSAKKNETFRST